MPIARVNGTDLFYTEIGRGVPILVMHGGLGVDHTQFREWLDPLGDVFHLVYYDHRGNGCSGRSPTQAERMHQGIRGSQKVIFERSGHYPFVEENAAFQGAVRMLLRREV